MKVRSVGITFTIECPSCRMPLPVNQASEETFCPNCASNVPTPVNLWEYLISNRIEESLKMKEEENSWAKGLHAAIGSYRLEFGNLAPRCSKCGAIFSLDNILSLEVAEGTRYTCTKCGEITSVRKPPPWFAAVAPQAMLLVGEFAPDAAGRIVGINEAAAMHCYHCGGALPLDGTKRTVRCAHCGQELLVPDDIWQRIHPEVAARRWYVLLEVDDALPLPTEIDEFLDLEALPGGDVALLWKAESKGYLGRADRKGLLRWQVSDLAISDHARLLLALAQNLLWILDREEDVVCAFSAERGERRVSIEKKKNLPEFITAVDHEGIAACTDGTLLVYRCWEDDNYALRRFDAAGNRISLWPETNDEDLPKKRVKFDELKSKPARLPDGAWIAAGPKGALYVIERETGRCAIFNSNGVLRKVIVPQCEVVEKIQDCGVSKEGSVYILFDHRERIGDLNFSHVGVIAPDGSFSVLAGPHAKKHAHSLGTDVERMAVAENGDIYLCDRGFDNFRILSKEGTLIWRSTATAREDKNRAKELEEARGG